MIEQAPAKWLDICGVNVYAVFTKTEAGGWQGNVAQFAAGSQADDYATCERALRHAVVSNAEVWLQKAVPERDSDRAALVAENTAKEVAELPKPATDEPEPSAESLDELAEGGGHADAPPAAERKTKRRGRKKAEPKPDTGDDR